jgi:tetratricopeptide (TPR) repeat protein
MLPTSGFYMLLSPSYIADRYLYIPMMGLVLTLGCLLMKLRECIGGRVSRLQAASLATVFLVCFGAYNYERSQIWKNNLNFWGYAVTEWPQDFYIKINYGIALMESKHYESAYKFFLKMKPGKEGNPFLDYFIAKSLVGMSDYESARKFTSMAVQKDPKNATFIALLAKISMLTGRRDDSLNLCRIALNINPWQKDAKEILGKLTSMQLQ